ncbi:sigma-70 family RNA polymerase sigma factor [Sphingomicrobium lutaoense]|uniref:RNA polymerase sigma-70 factor (ECF subfamily) n=1 Tax=Sphingomicrobium lutaoense TaxID=515949 RepID=A0A839YY05_9SPHN|nr:sigma-70 family RNA polymerase sigma factor [Sphingomicrobium lutaoense]MBB3764049.1 RNA polymerase sigma-70 factor (ECF subfamily) [Sphingomicrobium lutaoense]
MILAEEDMRRLMAMSQRGDKQAYRAALSGATHWLRRFFARRIAAHMIDDLVQETLIGLHVKRASYDARRPFYPWLAAIARYRWIDQLRKLERLPDEDVDAVPSVPSDEEPVLARLSLDRLLIHIPEGQAQAITLTRIEGRSIREAARITGQSESLVKVNIHRGLKRLAALVESE